MITSEGMTRIGHVQQSCSRFSGDKHDWVGRASFLGVVLSQVSVSAAANPTRSVETCCSMVQKEANNALIWWNACDSTSRPERGHVAALAVVRSADAQKKKRNNALDGHHGTT